MGVPADGSYGLGKGVYYSVPVTCEGGAFACPDAPLGQCRGPLRPVAGLAARPSERACQARVPASASSKLADSTVSAHSGGPVQRVGGIPITPDLATAMEAQRVALSK